MRINRTASLNAFFQVSQSFLVLAKFGVNLHHSCKDSGSKIHWCAIQTPDGSYIHLDMRSLPSGSKTSLISDPKNEAMAKVPTRQRLANFEALLNSSFDCLEALLLHVASTSPL